MARAGQGPPKVSPGPAMPCLSTPLKRSCGRFRGGPPAGQAAIFYPFGHHTPYAYVPTPHEVRNWVQIVPSCIKTRGTLFPSIKSIPWPFSAFHARHRKPNPPFRPTAPHPSPPHHGAKPKTQTPWISILSLIINSNKRRDEHGWERRTERGMDVRNFPYQTLKISKVSLVVMGS
jgi:hypothetical protein